MPSTRAVRTVAEGAGHFRSHLGTHLQGGSRWPIALLSLSIRVVDPDRPMGLVGWLLVGPHDTSSAASINDNGLTGDETRTIGRQEKGHLRDVVRKTGPGYWLKGSKIGDAIFDK